MSRGARLGLTTRGSALLTAGITAAVCGVALGQRDLVRVAFLLMAVPLAASIIISRSRLSIACQRIVTPERVAPGEPVLVQLTLINQSILPTGSLMLQDSLPSSLPQRARFTLDSLRSREQRSLAYRVPLGSRGHYSIGPLRMRLADPFGLVERTRSFRSVNSVVVRPTVSPLSQSQLPGAWDSAHQASSHSVGSLGADDASIREYRYGDDLRKVHWRSTARLGSIMVRQEERPWHARTVLLLDTRAEAHRRASSADGPGQRRALDVRETDSFEWAVSAFASICVLLRSKGREVAIVAGSLPTSVGNPDTLLDRLADLEVTGAADLRDALQVTDSIGRDSTLIAILGSVDETSIRLLSKERRSPGSAVALLMETATWSDPLPEPTRRRLHDAYDLARVRLTGAGWRVAPVRCGDSIEEIWAELISTPMPGRARRDDGPADQVPIGSRLR